MLSTPKELNPYRLAFEKKQELKDIELWTLGRYVQESVLSSFTNKHKYPDKPYSSKLYEKELPEAKKISDADRFEMFAARYNQRFNK